MPISVAIGTRDYVLDPARCLRGWNTGILVCGTRGPLSK